VTVDRERTIHEINLFDDNDDGVIRSQQIRVTERWESLDEQDRVQTSGATREDLVFTHLQSNGAFARHRQFLQEHPQIRGPDYEVEIIPLAHIRKVTRTETMTVWEEVTNTEDVDELTEQLNCPPCPHAEDKRQKGMRGPDYCGRCGSPMTDPPKGPDE
jgi:hypothetical protein